MKRKRRSRGRSHTHHVFRWHRNKKLSSKTHFARMDSAHHRFKLRLIYHCHKSGRRGRAWAYLGKGSFRNSNSGQAQTPKLPSIKELNFSTERSRRNKNVKENQILHAWMMVKVFTNRLMKLLHLIPELVSPNTLFQSVGRSFSETENFTANNDVWMTITFKKGSWVQAIQVKSLKVSIN